MSWSKKTEGIWKAFENAVLNRDKNQFEIYHIYTKSKEKDKQKVQDEQLVL